MALFLLHMQSFDYLKHTGNRALLVDVVVHDETIDCNFLYIDDFIKSPVAVASPDGKEFKFDIPVQHQKRFTPITMVGDVKLKRV